MRYILLMLILLFSISCGTSDPSENLGTENNKCFEDQTCNRDLFCDAGICVKEKTCSNCKEWEACNNNSGICELKPNRCRNSSDCDENKQSCSNHTCVSKNDPCKNATCSGHGECRVDNEEAKCICNDGYQENGLECKFICDTNNHFKVNPNNDGCICENGYHTVGNNCVENKKCSDSTCGTGVCSIVGDEISCDCSNTGFTGYRCEVDIDECNIGQHDCDNNANCTNEIGTFSCECNQGYSGDGKNCSDINECTNGQHNCDNNANCINEIGTFSCECKQGYSGNGISCTKIDNCSPNPCKNGGICTNSEQSYSCNCKNTAYTGDTCTIARKVWCNIEHPKTIPPSDDNGFVFGQIYVEGITIVNQENNMITASFGYVKESELGSSVENTNFIWLDTTFNKGNAGINGSTGNNHEYATIFPPSDLEKEINYKYLYRFSLNANSYDDSNAIWHYCDTDGAGGQNNDPFEMDKLGTANIPEEAPAGSDLFISEYVEGNKSNKAIEIYNPTNSSINLNQYSLRLSTNGKNFWDKILVLSGTIEAKKTYVFVKKSTLSQEVDPNLTAKADREITQQEGVVDFNGDDTIALFKGEELLDTFGKLGVDPGSSWPIAGNLGAGKDHTVRRKTSINKGSTNWDTSAGTSESNSEWEIYPMDTFTNLGIR